MLVETRTFYILDTQEFSGLQEALDCENALKLRALLDDLEGISVFEVIRICARLVERRSEVLAILLCGTYEE